MICLICENQIRHKKNTQICDSCLFQVRHLSGRDRNRELARIKANFICGICGEAWKKNERSLDCHHKLKGECGVKTRSYDRLEDIQKLLVCHHKCHLNLHSVREKMAASH